MDVMLLFITTIAVAAAVGCGTLAWQARRDERARSEARVALLSEAIDGPRAVADGASSPHPLFSPERHEAARGNPLIKAAVGIAMTLALVVGVAMATHDAPATGSSAAAAATTPAPLELLSMRHVRDGGALTVTGLVRNPRGARDQYGVSAVIYAFGHDGALITSARAPLDALMLRPGDESAFVVTIPGGNAVERYRVTFRTDRGVIRHLDRRNSTTRMATAAPAAGSAR